MTKLSFSNNYWGGIRISNILFLVQITGILLLSSLHIVNSAKILVFIGISSHSHRVAIQPLATKLSEIGHEVTFLSPIKPEVKNPKIKEFCPKALLDFNNQLVVDVGDAPVVSRIADRYSDAFMENWGKPMRRFSSDANEIILTSPDFLAWMNNTRFDLVITEQPYKEVSLAIAYKHGAKVIGFSASAMIPGETDMFGIPTESSWLPDMTMGSRYKFIPDRFSYEINYIMWHLSYRWWHLPKMNSLIQKAFKGDGIPHVEDLVKNIKLLFVNTHYSNEYARSLPPFVVPIGGMHVQETTESLPQNIEAFIASGSEGFVYISFGSAARISGLPDNARKDFFNAIQSFPNARFLIKWNDEIPEDMPKNVLPMKWLPQQDLLGHTKCRGFVSQGGLMSLQQATYHGVPVVVMPVFGDQSYNAHTYAQHGIGIHLDLQDLTLETFSDALRQLLFSDELSNKAKEVARRFKDRPMSPIDTAVWWTEYVLRHNDTSHLKPLGINQEWWQRRLLDFWATVFTAFILMSFTIVMTIRSLIRFCRPSFVATTDKIKRS